MADEEKSGRADQARVTHLPDNHASELDDEASSRADETLQDAHVVDFAIGDPEDPNNWPEWRKWSIVVAVSLITATPSVFPHLWRFLVSNYSIRQLATVIAAPVAPQILRAFNSTSTTERTLLVSIWELGEVVGPLLCGPLSELYGRARIVNVANLGFFAFSLGTALSTNIDMLIAFRFLTGASVVGSTLAPVIISDLFPKERRGAALSTMMMANLIAPAIGPIIGSYLGQEAGWRWAFWLTTILSGISSVFFVLVYRESYKVTLLSRRAKRLRNETGDPAWRSKYSPLDSMGNEVGAKAMFADAIWRPLMLLMRSPMLIIMTVYVSVCIGLFTLLLTVIAPLFQDQYHFSEGAAGVAFLGLVIGLLGGTLLCRFTLDKLVRKVAGVEGGEVTPEQRLPPLLVAAPFIPAGLFMFGWTAERHVHWMAPIVATGVVGFGYAAVTIVTRSYVLDAYGVYGASAIAAMLVPENATAAFLPLAGPSLYSKIGLGWGNSVLGFIALAFCALPVVLMAYGKRLRSSQTVKVAQ